MARVIGLTGGIACGKSVVTGMLRERGAAVVDADKLARAVVAPGQPAYDGIVAEFGGDMVDENGHLARKKLAALVFGDPGKRRALEAITHPYIAAAGRDAIAELAAQGADPVIYDAALIVENGLHKWMDGLIVVTVTEEIQLVRLMVRDRIGRDAAQARIAAQLPVVEKVAVADYVIDNSGTLEETSVQVAVLWGRLQLQAGGS